MAGTERGTVPDEWILRFERERETKNTIRDQELATNSEYVVGLCTSAKPSCRLGDPRELTVIVCAADAAASESGGV
jgi:hypothetical protein